MRLHLIRRMAKLFCSQVCCSMFGNFKRQRQKKKIEYRQREWRKLWTKGINLNKPAHLLSIFLQNGCTWIRIQERERQRKKSKVKICFANRKFMAEVLTTDRKIRFTVTNSKVQVNFGRKKNNNTNKPTGKIQMQWNYFQFQ